MEFMDQIINIFHLTIQDYRFLPSEKNSYLQLLCHKVRRRKCHSGKLIFFAPFHPAVPCGVDEPIVKSSAL